MSAEKVSCGPLMRRRDYTFFVDVSEFRLELLIQKKKSLSKFHRAAMASMPDHIFFEWIKHNESDNGTSIKSNTRNHYVRFEAANLNKRKSMLIESIAWHAVIISAQANKLK